MRAGGVHCAIACPGQGQTRRQPRARGTRQLPGRAPPQSRSVASAGAESARTKRTRRPLPRAPDRSAKGPAHDRPIIEFRGRAFATRRRELSNLVFAQTVGTPSKHRASNEMRARAASSREGLAPSPGPNGREPDAWQTTTLARTLTVARRQHAPPRAAERWTGPGPLTILVSRLLPQRRKRRTFRTSPAGES